MPKVGTAVVHELHLPFVFRLTAFGSRYSLEEVQQGYARKVEPDVVNALFAEVKKHTKSAFDITGIKLYD